MNKLITILLVFGFPLISSCDDNDQPCIGGTDSTVVEMRTVPSFHSISLEGIGRIILTQGSPQSINIDTHERILDILTTNVVNEVLEVEMEGCISGQVSKLDISITIPEIRNIEISGVGSLIGQNDFDLDNLNVELSGVGDVTLNGTTGLLDISTSGVGTVHAFQMRAEDCEVAISGSGNIEVLVENTLEVKISGSGNVLYKGTPVIDTTITGTGGVINTN